MSEKYKKTVKLEQKDETHFNFFLFIFFKYKWGWAG